MNQETKLEPLLTEAVGLPTGPVPAALYTDSEQFERERERIFGRAWLKVGRVEQIPEAGDFFVKEIAVRHASVIITRAKDGGVRAFHNTCSHRGNQVVLASQGRASRFTCRYHSWTYRNTGELIGVPDESGFVDLDKKKCGLTPIACDTWDGWIFINFQTAPEVSLKEFLGSFGEALGGIPYPHAENCMIMRGVIKANWKTVGDNFSEPYHIASIHPQTLAPVYSGKSNPGARPVSANLHGPHRAIGTWLNTDYVPSSNARFAAWLYTTAQTMTGTRQEGQANQLCDHPHINPSNSEQWASDVNWIFPNWHLQVSANRFWTHEFWPIEPGLSMWEGRFYQPKPATLRERLQLEHFCSMIADTFLEDLANIESTQRGMASGAKSFLHLHEAEILIRHSLQQVDKWVKAASVAEALA